MKKVFVLDTNVLIHDPEAILHFEDNDVMLPITVIEELDKLKRGNGEIPYSARQALNLIDKFREKGKLSKGVKIGEGKGTLKTYICNGDLPKDLDVSINDNKIIAAAVAISRNGTGGWLVILVSKDTSVRVKVDSLKEENLEAQDYLHDKTTMFLKYGNVADKKGALNEIRSRQYYVSGDKTFHVCDGRGDIMIKRRWRSVSKIVPKNIEQECAIDALLDPNVSVVALTGRAGTGKTLLAMAAGIHLCSKKNQGSQEKLYEQVMVVRPIVPLGNDIGFIPGDIGEKLHPWMQPIRDNLDVITSALSASSAEGEDVCKDSEDFIKTGLVHMEPLVYIRGRSLPRRYLVIDESQNLKPKELKTIITRCGEGTKVVFTGDMDQIDNPYLDSASNGLAYLISRYINEPYFCYLRLRQSARSYIAERAAELL